MPRKSMKRHMPAATEQFTGETIQTEVEFLSWLPWLDTWFDRTVEQRQQEAQERLDILVNDPLADWDRILPDYNAIRGFLRHVVDSGPEEGIRVDEHADALLDWFYRRVLQDTASVPSPSEIVTQLHSIVNDVEVHDGWFEHHKKHTFHVIAFSLACSVKASSAPGRLNPSEATSGELYLYIGRHIDDFAGKEAYNPLYEPVLAKVLDLVVQTLANNQEPVGIGPYGIEDLRRIFAARQLLCLDACVKHWQDPELWTWDELLKHLGLGAVMNKKMLQNTASEIRTKLIEHQQMLHSLDLGLADLKEW